MDRQEKEDHIRLTFDTVADKYDHRGASWFDLTASALSKTSQLAHGERALDVATGTGKVALSLAASCPGAEVVGVDLSPGMLAQARAKAEQAQLDNLSFHRSSFEDLAFDQQFDLLTCSFGIFFVEQMAETLSGFSRHVRDGGRLLLSTFKEGSFSPFQDVIMALFAEFGVEAPVTAWLRIATPESIAELFCEAGLPAPEVVEHDFSLELPDAEAWWALVENAGYRGLLLQLSDEEQREFKERHLSDVRVMMEEKGLSRLNVRVLIARCVKAGD